MKRRKGHYSLNCQMVSTQLLLFTNVECRWYGIFGVAFFCCFFLAQLRRGEVNPILIGDPAYTCTTYMIPPGRHPRIETESRYNRAHDQVFEITFGSGRDFLALVKEKVCDVR